MCVFVLCRTTELKKRFLAETRVPQNTYPVCAEHCGMSVKYLLHCRRQQHSADDSSTLQTPAAQRRHQQHGADASSTVQTSAAYSS